jgi:hypothetical protein
VAEDTENFRCGGGLLDYVQILYGNKGSQQKYGLEVPQRSTSNEEKHVKYASNQQLDQRSYQTKRKHKLVTKY